MSRFVVKTVFMPSTSLEMHQNRFRPGLRPGPHWGSLQRSLRPLAGGEGARRVLPKNPTPPRPFRLLPYRLCCVVPQHPTKINPSYGLVKGHWVVLRSVRLSGCQSHAAAAAAEVRRVRRWRCTAIKCCRSCHGTACDFGVRNRRHRLCCTEDIVDLSSALWKLCDGLHVVPQSHGHSTKRCIRWLLITKDHEHFRRSAATAYNWLDWLYILRPAGEWSYKSTVSVHLRESVLLRSLTPARCAIGLGKIGDGILESTKAL